MIWFKLKKDHENTVKYGGKKRNKCLTNIPQYVAQAMEIIETGKEGKPLTLSTFPM